LKQLDASLADIRPAPDKQGAEKKMSIGERLKAGKEKVEANRDQRPADAAINKAEVR
jgi:hypothetical protein